MTPRRTLEEMQKLMYGNSGCTLSPELFGKNAGAGIGDMLDFEICDYRYFIDNVESLQDLILGLTKISPFADDALNIAESMDVLDFSTFKLALTKERKAAEDDSAESCMPDRFIPLVLPERFISAILLAEAAAVALGVALIRILETE